MIVGSNHFTTFGAALRHYRGYRPNTWRTNYRQFEAYVKSKLATGEIKIGPPAGQIVGTDEGRYLVRV